MARLLLPVVVLAAVFAAPACHEDAAADACKVGEQRCDGDTLVVCSTSCSDPAGCPPAWQPHPCLGACVQPLDIPFCALSDQADPKCASVSGYCDGNAIVRCADGYQIERDPCAVPGVCVATEQMRAFCGLSKNKDTRCPQIAGTTDTFLCEGDALVTCQDGYLRDMETCAKGCENVVGGHAHCVGTDGG